LHHQLVAVKGLSTTFSYNLTQVATLRSDLMSMGNLIKVDGA
jgi:hypothetical protein